MPRQTTTREVHPVVVGGSIAGAVAALRLAADGVPVTVLEARRSPGAKVCGEGLHPIGRRIVESVAGDLADLGWPLHGFEFSTPQLDLLDLAHPADQVGIGCDRLLLESRLWERMARHPLVEFRVGATVSGVHSVGGGPVGVGWRVELRDEVLTATHVIAADGVRSKLRRATGRRRHRSRGRWGLRQRYATEASCPHTVQVCFLGDGQVFLTPLARNRMSVAVLGNEALIRSLRDPEVLAGYIAPLTNGDGILANAQVEDAGRALPHAGFPARPWCRDRLYLTGDAAAFLDPISGSGMTLAAVSAVLAAASIVAVRDGVCDDRAAEGRTELEMRRSVRPFRRLTQLLLILARSPVARSTVTAVLRRSPGLLARLARPTWDPSVFEETMVSACPGIESPNSVGDVAQSTRESVRGSARV